MKKNASGTRVILFYKPFGVLSQFSGGDQRVTLKDFGPFPRDVYPAGRLDADSEGLLLLTNDNALTHRLTDPKFGHPRTYLVQVEGIPTGEALMLLRQGVVIKGGKTRPVEVRLLPREPVLQARSVPIRFRLSVPTSWLELVLREGRNRQVRRMTAALGYPTLRLVRSQIGKVGLGHLKPGEYCELSTAQVAKLRRDLGLVS